MSVEKSGSNTSSPRSDLALSRRHSKLTVNSSLSNSSRISVVMLKQKDKAEAAKTRQKFIKQEIELELKKAALQGDLKLLQSNRDVEEAEAELNVIKEAVLSEAEQEKSEDALTDPDIKDYQTENIKKFVDMSIHHQMNAGIPPEQPIRQTESFLSRDRYEIPQQMFEPEFQEMPEAHFHTFPQHRYAWQQNHTSITTTARTISAATSGLMF